MKLSDLQSEHPLEVVRDGAFNDLGLAGWRGEDALIPLYGEKFVSVVLKSPSLACLLTTRDLLDDIPEAVPVAVCENPMDVFLKIHIGLVGTPFYGPYESSRISPDASVHPTAFVDDENVEIGAGTIIGPNATILSGTTIGAECRIGPGTVIGYEGFEIRSLDGRWQCIPHAGGVVLGDRVDVQANCSIAKSIYKTPTRIGSDSKIGHLSFISHGVSLGHSCRVAANATISGYTLVGDDVWIGPGAQISNGLRIGDGSFITLGSVVVENVEPGGKVSGNFAMDHVQFLRQNARAGAR